MRSLRRVLLIGSVITVSLLFGFLGGLTYASQGIKLIVDGKEIATDQPPFIKNGRTFVPVRFVAEALGYPVKWEEKNQSVIVGVPPEGVDLVTDLAPFKQNANKITSSVKVAGVSYSKGYILENYKTDDLIWNLGGRFKSITFYFGPGDNNRYDGSTLTLKGDGKEITESITVSKSEGLKECHFDISGVKILTVDCQGEGVLLNPRVQ